MCVHSARRQNDQRRIMSFVAPTKLRRGEVQSCEHLPLQGQQDLFPPILHECHPRDHKVRPEVASVKSTGILGVWHDGVDVRSSLAGGVN